MKRTLVFIGGGIETLPGVRLAQTMGLRVVVTDGSAAAPCLAQADHPLLADTYNPAATLRVLAAFVQKNGPIHGVLCLGSDVPHTVAQVAEAHHLPGHSIETAALAMDKLAMKQRFLAAGVPVPWFAPVADTAELLAIIRAEGLPLVIKPVDSRGARGVIRLTSDVDPRWAFQCAQRFSPTGRVMVERYLDGPQISTESMFIDGSAYTPGFSDRNYERLEQFAPYFIEDGGQMPSHLPRAACNRIRDLVGEAGRALGARNGVVKGDIVWHRQQPYVIELAARLSGGYFCTHSIPLNTGVPFVELAIRQAMGEVVQPHELDPRWERFVCQRYLFPSPGEVIDVRGADRVSALPQIAFLDLRVQPGSVVPAMESHPARAGVLIATGSSAAAALKHAEDAVAALKITTRPQ